jgi:hypothetical protein
MGATDIPTLFYEDIGNCNVFMFVIFVDYGIIISMNKQSSKENTVDLRYIDRNPVNTDKLYTSRQKVVSAISAVVALTGVGLFAGHAIEHAAQESYIPQPALFEQPNPDVSPLLVDGGMILAGIAGVMISTRRER